MRYAELPDELPEKPAGWKQNMRMHLNQGSGRHSAVYELSDETGRVLPITREYIESGKVGGFVLPGVKQFMTWRELRAIWPRWIAIARKKQASR